MIILSLNLRGFGGTIKISSLKALLSGTKPDIVFLQETLVSSDKAIKLFLQCAPSWNAVALNPSGRYDGLLSGWNLDFAELSAFDTLAGIYMEGMTKMSTIKVKLLNCYAPYKDMEQFWLPILHSSLLNEEGLIIGRYLNFTLSSKEVWGSSTRLDPLTDFFRNLLHSSGC